ncbi:MAG: DUF5658 family protein [Desulfobacterales bacterium]
MTEERRSGIDRRKNKKVTLRSLLWGGKREQIRRFEDRQKSLHVDRYHHSIFGVIVLILLLSVIDAFLTIHLLNHGAIEINPVMAFYLDVGPYTFLFVKYALTSAGLMILLLGRDYFLHSLNMRVGAFLYVILIAFIGVVSWQIFLIHRVLA